MSRQVDSGGPEQPGFDPFAEMVKKADMAETSNLSQGLYSRVLAYLDVQAQIENLTALLSAAEQQQSNQSSQSERTIAKEGKESLSQFENIFNTTARNLRSATASLRDASNQYQGKNPRSSFEQLLQVVKSVVQEEVPPELLNSLTAFEEEEWPTLLLKGGLLQAAVEEQMSPAQRKALFLERLRKLANASPPTLLSKAAKELLKKGEMAEDPAEALEQLLNSLPELPEDLPRFEKQIPDTLLSQEFAKKAERQMTLDQMRTLSGPVNILFYNAAGRLIEQLKRYGNQSRLERELRGLENKLGESDSSSFTPLFAGIDEVVKGLVDEGKLTVEEWKAIEEKEQLGEKIQQTLDKQGEKLTEQMKLLEKEIPPYVDSQKAVETIDRLLHLPKMSPVPVFQAKQWASSTYTLFKNYPQLAPEERGAVDGMLSALATVKTVGGEPFPAAVGKYQAALVQAKDAEILKQAPSMQRLVETRKNVHPFFQVQAQSFALSLSKQQSVEELLADTSPDLPFDEGGGASAESFYDEGPKAAAAPPPMRKTAQAKKAVTRGAQMKVANYGAIAKANGDRRALGTILAHTLLKVYLPQQEKQMLKLGQLLYYQNYGANMCNQLLAKAIGWGDASHYYDFANYLQARFNPTSGMFSGRAADAKAVYDAELRRVDRDLTAIRDMRSDIGKKILDIDKEVAAKKMTPAQGKALKDVLNKKSGDLGNAFNNVTNLLNFLKPGGVEWRFQQQGNDQFNLNGPPGGPDWREILRQRESEVINGLPRHGNADGLVDLHGSLTSQQQTYSSLGQQQQIGLQALMTASQQVIGIITTLFQIYNQSMTTMAQALFR